MKKIILLIFVALSGAALAGDIVEVTGDQIAKQPFDLKSAKLSLPVPSSDDVKQISETEYRIRFAIYPRTVEAIITGPQLNSIIAREKANFVGSQRLYGDIQKITDDSVELRIVGNYPGSPLPTWYRGQ